MVEVQIAPIEDPPTVLAGVPIPLEEVVAGEFDFFLGKPIEAHQQDHPGNPDPEGDCIDRAVGLGIGRGEIAPLLEIQRPVVAVALTEHHLCVAVEEKRVRPTYRADVDRLPQPVEDKNLIAQDIAHRTVWNNRHPY